MPEEFFTAYVTTALWSSMDNSDPDTGGDPLDYNHGPEDIDLPTLAKMRADCQEFWSACHPYMAEEFCLKYGPDFGPDGRAGSDFWLTRNGHGAGFWDGDWAEPEASLLTLAAGMFGEFNLYVGDYDSIHGT